MLTDRGGPAENENSEVSLHCANLEACLQALERRKASPLDHDSLGTEGTLRGQSTTSVSYGCSKTAAEADRRTSLQKGMYWESASAQLSTTDLGISDMAPDSKPQVTVSEVAVEVQEMVRTVQVPKLSVQVSNRQVEIPRVQYLQRNVELPDVRIREKIVEVPKVEIQEVVKHVPRITLCERVRHVPKIQIQEVVRAVPKIINQIVEKIVEVPTIQTVEKIVEVPEVHKVNRYVDVPQVQVVEAERRVYPAVATNTVLAQDEVLTTPIISSFVNVPAESRSAANRPPHCIASAETGESAATTNAGSSESQWMPLNIDEARALGSYTGWYLKPADPVSGDSCDLGQHGNLNSSTANAPSALLGAAAPQTAQHSVVLKSGSLDNLAVAPSSLPAGIPQSRESEGASPPGFQQESQQPSHPMISRLPRESNLVGPRLQAETVAAPISTRESILAGPPRYSLSAVHLSRATSDDITTVSGQTPGQLVWDTDYTSLVDRYRHPGQTPSKEGKDMSGRASLRRATHI